jgi:putative thioredoxin
MSDVLAVSSAEFEREVVDESRRRPVLVDLWAGWCGPCRQLKPILHGVVQRLAGRARLATVDTDAERELAASMGVSSIPDVRLYVGGGEVDRFVGLRGAEQVLAWLKPHLRSPADDEARAAEVAWTAGDRDTATSHATNALGIDRAHAGALAVLLRVALASGDLQLARSLSGQLAKAPDGAARALELAPLLEMGAELSGLDRADPKAVRYAASIEAMLVGDAERALGLLLESVREDKTWNGGKARARMVEIFAIVGKRSALSEDYRSRLAATLY